MQAGLCRTWSQTPEDRICHDVAHFVSSNKREDHWSCIAHLSAEDMLKSVVTEEKKFKNIESERFGPRPMNDLDLFYSYSFMYSFS